MMRVSLQIAFFKLFNRISFYAVFGTHSDEIISKCVFDFAGVFVCISQCSKI